MLQLEKRIKLGLDKNNLARRLKLALSPMDTHLYSIHRPLTESIVPLNRPRTASSTHQHSPCYHPSHPNAYAVPPDPKKHPFTQIQLPAPQPLRARVQNPERFVGASCQWVFCNSSRRTPMLAYGVFVNWPYSRESHSVEAAGG